MAAYLALGLGYSLVTPVGEGPDEPEHLGYIVYLREEHRLPVNGEVTGPVAGQAKHPPLYYAMGMLAAAPFPLTDLAVVNNPHCCNLAARPSPAVMRHTRDELFPYAWPYRTVRWLRLLTLLAGILTIWATWAAARLLRPGQPALAVLAASAVAFLPQHLFMAGVVNNDGLAIPLAALAFLAALKVALGAARRGDLALLGVALGLGLLTKLTVLALAAVGAAAIGVAALRRRSWRRLTEALGLAGVPVLILAGWWFVRNWRLYGDPLGWGQWEQSAAALMRRTPLADQLPDYWAIQWTSFWGRFGWDTVPLPHAAYEGLAWVTRLAVLGLVLGLARWIKAVRVRPASPANAVEADASAWGMISVSGWGMAITVLTVVLVYASVFRLAFDFDLTVAQGRYLFTALPALAILFAAGLLAWVPRRIEMRAALMGAAALAAFATASLALVLWPAYRIPPRVDLAAATGFNAARPLDFGPHMHLLAYRLPPRVKAGENLDVELVWDTDRVPDSGYILFLHLVDANQEVPARLDALPLAGTYPTISWLPHWPFADAQRLVLAPWAAPGPAKLLVGWYPEGHGDEPLPARRPGSGEEVEAALGPIEIVR